MRGRARAISTASASSTPIPARDAVAHGGPARFFNRFIGSTNARDGRTRCRSRRPCRRAGSRAARCWSPGSATPPCWSRPGPQHPHRPDLVGARLAFLLRRPEAGAGAGRALRGPAEDRPRPRQPQSLRPYGPADPEAAVAARPSPDRHQPRQRFDPQGRAASAPSRSTGAEALPILPPCAAGDDARAGRWSR